MKQQITLYLRNGKTLRFEEVTNLKIDTEKEGVFYNMTFNYVSTSQGTNHQAFFNINPDPYMHNEFAHILGYSLRKIEVNENGIKK